MAKSVLDIVIRTIKDGTGDKEVVRGMLNVKDTITSAGVAFAAMAGAAYTVNAALDKTVGAVVRYAAQVREVQQATGANAEEASRLVQFSDDARISYEAFTMAMAKASREGITPNIEGLAQLSDEYLKLAPGADRASFLLDKFGRSGLEMAELMEKGAEGIREMAAGIDDSLLLTQEAVDTSREYERAVDALTEQWDKFAIRVGTNALPVVTKLIEGMNIYLDLAKHEEETYTRAAIYHNVVDTAMQNEANTMGAMAERYTAMAEAMSEANQAASDMAVNYGNLFDLTEKLQEGYDRFGEKEAEIRKEMELTNAALADGSINSDEHAKKMGELTAALDRNKKEMEDWSKRTVFALLQARLAADGGIDAAEFGFLVALGEQMGIIDEETATMAQSLNDSMDSIDLSKPESFSDLWKEILALPDEKYVKLTVEYENIGDPPPDTTGLPQPQAIGGVQRAGQPYLVHQDEVIVPSQGGYTLTRREAQEILRESAGGGGSSGRGVTIYGNVTIMAQGSVVDALEELG